MSKMIRAFIAAALPGTIADSLQEVQRQLKKDRLPIRWVKADNIHLTLKFLGDIRAEEISVVAQAMEKACRKQESFALRASRLGVFPNHRRPKVIWAGLAGDVGNLGALARNVDSALSDEGFPAEKRPFRSHLTIGRFKGAVSPDRVAGLLNRWEDWASVDFAVDRIHLFESRLNPEGAQYFSLDVFSLQGG